MRSIRRCFCIMMLGILVMAGACGNTDRVTLVATSPITDQPIPEPPTEPRLVYRVGDVTGIGDYLVAVLGWEYIQPNAYARPERGKKFLAVHVLIANTGTSATSVIALSQTILTDETKRQYRPDVKATIAAGGTSIDGDLTPGEMVRGTVGFQVPESSTRFALIFLAGIAGRVTVDLGTDPVSVERPVTITAESAPHPHHVGEDIVVGSIHLIVHRAWYPHDHVSIAPKPGFAFLAVDLSIKNDGTTLLYIAPSVQMSIKDAEGRQFRIDRTASVASGSSLPLGEIAPGDTVRGVVWFQVPQASSGLVFVLDIDIWSSGKVFVAVP